MLAERRLDLALAVVVALVLGLGTFSVIGHPSRLDVSRGWGQRGPTHALDIAAGISEHTQQAALRIVLPTPGRREANVLPSAPLEAAGEMGEDLEDVLLLYDSTRPSNFDANFCMVAEYYGLLCKKVDLSVGPLSDAVFKDGEGKDFKLTAMSAKSLLQGPSPLAARDLVTVRKMVEENGVSLLVSGLDNEVDQRRLSSLTEGAVLSVTQRTDRRKDWIVSSDAPEVTRELTGQAIYSSSMDPQGDYALTLNMSVPVLELVSSLDDTGDDYPIYVKLQMGKGSIFLDSCGWAPDFGVSSLERLYYGTYFFSDVMSIMFTIRYVMGDEVWHSNRNYANLTIDGPALTEPWHQISYAALLAEMEAHDFHTTIALEPVNWRQSELSVVGLFLSHPDRYSLAQHGNNADGYEFYRYPPPESIVEGGKLFRTRSLGEQEADILQGRARMEAHTLATGIPFDRVMIFPSGISPEPTLELLKKHNYLGTVNAQELPLDAARPGDWNFGMYQANTEFGNFPALTRRHPGRYEPFRPDLQPFVLDLFVGKPALFYSHAGELFASGIETFDVVADEINALDGEVEWRSLGYIMSHLYLEKVEDDGSIGVKMYGNHVVITNETSEERVYHIAKAEALNVPISIVSVNNHEFRYAVEEGFLILDMQIPPNASADLEIRYEE